MFWNFEFLMVDLLAYLDFFCLVVCQIQFCIEYNKFFWGKSIKKNGMIECSVCHSKLVSPTTKSVSRAYDRHKNRVSSKQRVLNVFLVVGDCMLVGLQVDSFSF